MNLACELNMGLHGNRRLQIDERGEAKLLNAYQVNGQRINNCVQVTLPPQRLKELAAAVRKMRAWKLAQILSGAPFTDAGGIRLSLMCPSGASVVGNYSRLIEGGEPIVGELRMLVERLMDDVEKTAKQAEEDHQALLREIDRQLKARSGWSPYYRFSDLVRSKLNVVLAAPKAKVATVRAYSGLAKRDIEVCVLPLKIENKSPQPIRTSLAHEWLGGEWPPTDIYAAVLRPAAPGKKANVDFKPVFLAGDRSELTKPTIIEPGKSTSLSLRLDWPGTGSVEGGEIVYPDRPGVYTVMFLLVFQTNGVRQYVVSEPIAFQYQKPDKDVQLKPAETKAIDLSGETSTAKPATDLLRQFKEEKDFWKQGEIAMKLIAAGDKAGVPEILQMLKSDHRHVRCNAGWVLARLGDGAGCRRCLRS